MRMSEKRAAHFLAWAIPFHQDVASCVGVLNGRIAHLWHGRIANRQYRTRHERLATIEFDPAKDLVLAASGAWDWTTNASPKLRHLLQGYFPSRLEDG
jgi:hypothetical protein